MEVDGAFFWLASVGGDGCAANNGGNVQRTTPGTSGSVGERQDGQRVAAVDNDGGSSGGSRGGGISLNLWSAGVWDEAGR